jgi:acetyltransferase-like isoleucine patch superfamily enzyme
MRNKIKKYLRSLLWKILGKRYFEYLKNQRKVYLCDFKEKDIGKYTYDNGAIVWRWNKESKISIGKYCSIAHGVQFFLDSGDHDYKKISTFPFHTEIFKDSELKSNLSFLSSKGLSIKIENDVWIGAEALIMPGVKIENGAVVLPGAVVVSNIGPYEIYGGVPGKLICHRFERDIIEKLLVIKWWDWDIELIENRLSDFYSDPKLFINKYGG